MTSFFFFFFFFEMVDITFCFYTMVRWCQRRAGGRGGQISTAAEMKTARSLHFCVRGF